MTLYTPYPNILIGGKGLRHNRAPFPVKLSNNEYRLAYQVAGLGGEDDDPEIYMADSVDGLHWSNLRKIASELAAGYNMKGPCLLWDGSTLWLSYNRTTADPVSRVGVFYRTSDDKGASWSAASEIETSYSDAAIGGPMVQLSNGDLIQPVWGGSGGAIDSAMMRSTDGGDTWGDETLIGDGSADGKYYYEPNIIQLANGDLLCLIRMVNDPDFDAYYATSADNGATWTAPALAFDGGKSAHRMLQLSNGDVITVYREDHDGSKSNIRTSDDNGATWSAAQRVGPPDQHSCTYGGIIEPDDVAIYHGITWAGGRGEICCKSLTLAELP